MNVPAGFAFVPEEIIHRVVDGRNDIEFKWVPATKEALQALPLQPAFIPPRISSLPQSAEHLVWRDAVPEPV
jgi:hypothetical protein